MGMLDTPITKKRAMIEVSLVWLLVLMTGFGVGLILGYQAGVNEAVREFAPTKIEKPTGAIDSPTMLAQEERTVWVMAVYRGGDLIRTATFNTQAECRNACIAEQVVPNTTCLCGARVIYRSKRGLS